MKAKTISIVLCSLVALFCAGLVQQNEMPRGDNLSSKANQGLEQCFDSSGEIVCGNAVFWDDLRFPPGIVGRGSAAPADIDATMGYLLFATNQDEDVFVQAQMPHGYILGSDLVAHAHWGKSTSASGTVAWKISYECADMGETFTNSLGTTLALAESVSDSDTAYKQALAQGTMSDPDFSSTSGMCMIRFWRDVSEDDYAADAILYEFDLHYQSDQRGSETQTTK